MARIRAPNGSTSWPTPGRSPGQRQMRTASFPHLVASEACVRTQSASIWAFCFCLGMELVMT